jgi:hypothetical protein
MIGMKKKGSSNQERKEDGISLENKDFRGNIA